MPPSRRVGMRRRNNARRDQAIRATSPRKTELIIEFILTPTRVITVASPAYLKTRGRPKHLKDIEQADCTDFYDAVRGRAHEWEMRRKNKVLPLRVKGRLLTPDRGAMLGAREAGAGIVQVLEIGCEHLLRSGRLIELFPERSDERFAPYAIYPSRHHRAAKVRAFIDFVVDVLKIEAGQRGLAKIERSRRPRRLDSQSPRPRGSASPDEPAATLRTLEIAADDSERRTSIAGTLPPMSVSEAYVNRVPVPVGVSIHSPRERSAMQSAVGFLPT